MKYKLSLGLVLLCAQALVHANDAAANFEEIYAKAVAQTSTSEGAVFDQALGRYFFALPSTQRGMSECLRRYPGQHKLRGYFVFPSSGSYQLVLSPQGPLASCFANVYEGKTPPEPPRRPFLDSFVFRVEK